MKRLLIWGLGMWFVFMVMAIINAGARENLYSPHMSELRAHQLSSLIFSTVIIASTYAFVKLGSFNLPNNSFLFLGIMWLAFTIVFEFLAGHYIFGNSWEKIFADYNIFRGRLWSMVLLTITLSPWLISKITD